MSSSAPLFSKFLCLFAAVTILSIACQKQASDMPASAKEVRLFLTDDPSLVFDRILIDIRKVEIKVEDRTSPEQDHHGNSNGSDDNHGNSSAGWITMNATPGVYDILAFRNGLDTLFSTGSFQLTTALKKVRLTLGTNNKVVYNGVTYPLGLKENSVEIKLEEEMVALNSNGAVSIWLDFDGGRSIRMNGNGFQLEPSIKAFSKEKGGRIEGRVTPSDAKPIVLAINGSDTATAKPEREGEFKIMGLKAGTYKLWVHATANNYADVVIPAITVRTNEDTKAGTITLHK
ncbi:MAG: DUF4382 domain-containing protein [Williamsia sp.]|nr:DUF4382 domain-containing protein [Williamsia sp.]